MKYDIKYEETNSRSPDTWTDSTRVESRDEQLGSTRRGLKGRHIQLIALGMAQLLAPVSRHHVDTLKGL